jgi:predicted HTH domain antitoxin
MSMMTLQFPDQLGFNAKDTMRFIAAKLYESGRLSLGQAAEMVGLSKLAFAEILKDYEVSFINYPASDIAEDVANI